MKSFFSVKFLSAIFAVALASTPQLPQNLMGVWAIGKAYDTNQPDGLSEKQTRLLSRRTIQYTPSSLVVCGKSIPVESLSSKSFTSDAFATKYHFTPKRIGFSEASVNEIEINYPHATHACGNFEDPGTTVIYADGDPHIVIEVANAYFALSKR